MVVFASVSADLDGSFPCDPRQALPEAIELAAPLLVGHAHRSVNDLRGQDVETHELQDASVDRPQDRVDVAVESVLPIRRRRPAGRERQHRALSAAHALVVDPAATVQAPHREHPVHPPLQRRGQGTRTEVDNARLIEFVSRQAVGCKAVLSVCTGAFILHAAGLLAGRRATTHWSFLDRLRARGDVTVVEERFTRDDKIWCAAGVSAGIDLTLAFIADTAGEDAAGKVQFWSEYYPSAIAYGSYTGHAQAPAYVRSTPVV
jgi:hypothetical protein